MFRKYKVTVAAIITVVILITVTFLGFGLTTGSALAAQNTLENFEYWFDLETGTVTHFAIPVGEDPTSDYDFTFDWNYPLTETYLIQNTYGVEVGVAYSEEDYENVEYNDVATLSFTTAVTFVPFNKVAVIHTIEGNYFKVGFLSADPYAVTFQWHQLVPGYDEGYEDGYQAGLDSCSATVADLEADLLAANQEITDLEADLLAANQEITELEEKIGSMYTQQELEEIKNLLATPPGQRSSTSSYEGILGEIIEMILAPQGSNISENTPQGKKK